MRPLVRATPLVLALLAAASVPVVRSQSPAPPPTSAPSATAPSTPAPAAAPASPLAGIRNKLAAGDLLSAESILEVHRAEHGEDGPWLAGLGWLARGALLVGDTVKAGRYVARTRDAVRARLAGRPLEADRDAETALGAAVEVEAQLLQRRRGDAAAARWLEGEIARLGGPPAFRSRLHKRLNLISLVGRPAPELQVEAFLLPPPDPQGELSVEDLLANDWSAAAGDMLGAARGRPVVLFLWAEWCSDCRAQAPALARVLARHRDEGLLARAVTRWYEPAESLATERARALRVWDQAYAGLGDTPRIVSTASMVRYGGSATPTFVFIDRRGIVRDYVPTRLTEEELERRIARILR